MCEICPKLTIKTPDPSQWRRSGVFIVKFEQISYIVLVFGLVNAGWATNSIDFNSFHNKTKCISNCLVENHSKRRNKLSGVLFENIVVD